MVFTFQLADSIYRIDASSPLDISIPLDFSGEQPHAFHLPRAESHAVEAGGFVGDTRRGGGCNCETITFNPHGNGTHTECVGHVSNQRLPVSGFLRGGFMPALLVTVAIVRAGDDPRELRPGVDSEDRMISEESLSVAVESLGIVPSEFYRSMIVRTLPNAPTKRTTEYSGANPPYVSQGAMRLLRRLGTEHLLLDLPSADREDDGGALAAHRIFWGVEEQTHDMPIIHGERTITEMVYVDDTVPDGFYLLDLQIPNFLLDAAPSRPLIFPVTRAE